MATLKQWTCLHELISRGTLKQFIAERSKYESISPIRIAIEAISEGRSDILFLLIMAELTDSEMEQAWLFDLAAMKGDIPCLQVLHDAGMDLHHIKDKDALIITLTRDEKLDALDLLRDWGLEADILD